MVTPADNHSETSTAAAGANPPERASRQRPFVFRKGIFRRDRYRLDERQRFYLLLGIFNVMLICVMVLLSLRQRLIREVRWLEVTVTRVVVERLACETESAELEAMLSRTPTFTPVLTPSPTSPLRSPSLSPTVSSTATPLPTEPSPTAQPATQTPTPTTTPTCTPVPTPTIPPTPKPRPPDTPTATYTPTPTITPTLPPPHVLGITPTLIVRADSGTPVSVVITGSNFFPGATANLGFVPVDIPGGVTDTTTIYGAVPVSMGTGVYNLRVTNTDTQSDTRLRAFTVIKPMDPDKVLECSYLATFGLDSGPEYGYDDHVQLVFFDMPDTVTDSVYIRVHDPATGDQGILDKFKESDPSWNTTVSFSVYGRSGAYSDPAARASQYMTITDSGIGSGTLLDMKVFTDTQAADWYAFGPFVPPDDAEHVGDRYVFKLAVVGESGNDGNLYDVALSTSPDASIVPSGARAFAFSWTMVLTDSARPGLYPYLDLGLTTFTQHNCDFDCPLDCASGTMAIRTPEQEFHIDGSNISANSDCRASSFDLDVAYVIAETGSSWAVDFAGFGFTRDDDDNENYATFWATGPGDVALPVFTRPETMPAP